MLALLTERPMHGYEMIQEIDSRTGGAWRPSPGSIYPTLQLLEDEGVIVASARVGRRAQAVHPHRGRPGRGHRGGADPALGGLRRRARSNSWHDIRDAGAQAMNALRQVMMTGTDDQRERAAQVLDETRRKLYAILAESE